MPLPFRRFLVIALLASARLVAACEAPKEFVFPAKPYGLTLSIKMDGPYAEPADLQIICLFKHKATGDTYQGAAKDTDERLHGVLSGLRNSGDFIGELGETILVAPKPGTIPAKRFMVIGLGDERNLSLDNLRLVGRIAVREAVRLQAKHVAWAPVIRDEGNTTLEVPDTDRAFVEQLIAAYGTEVFLQEVGLAPKFAVETFVIQAGPKYFDSAVQEVGKGIDASLSDLARKGK